MRLAVIKNRQPEPDFKYRPPKQYTHKSRKEGIRQRYCSREWFRMNILLCYSKSTDGFFLFMLCALPNAISPGQESGKYNHYSLK